MRTFGSDFAAALRLAYLDSFYSVDLPVLGDILYIAEREHTFGSHIEGVETVHSTYLPLIPRDGIGDLVSGTRRAAKTFEIQGLDIPILNQAVDALGGKRFSDYIDDAFESRRVKVYLNVRDASRITSRELVFEGIPKRPIAYSMAKATVRLQPISELYLNNRILRTITAEDYPDAPESSIGQPIRIVVGSVPKVPATLYSRTGGVSLLALCESVVVGHAATAIGDVYWNGETFNSGGVISNLVEDTTATLDGDESWGQTFTVTSTMLLASVTCKPWKTAATEPFAIDIMAAPGHIPTGASLASITVEPAEVATGSPGTPLTKMLETPIVLQPGIYAIVFTTSDVYGLRLDTSGAYAGGQISSSSGGWHITGSGADFYFAVNGATVTKTLSISDGTGGRVARLSLDVEVPDGVVVTADVTMTSDTDLPTSFVGYLLERAGYTSSDIDYAGTFAASAALYASTDRLDGVIDDPAVTYKSVILQIAFEARAIFDWPINVALWKYIETTPTIDETIGMGDIVTGGLGSALPLISVVRTDPRDIVNSIDARYSRDWTLPRGLEAYAATAHAEDATSMAQPWGRREPTEKTTPSLNDFLFDFIRNATAAANRASFYVAQLKNPKDEVTVTMPFTKLALEKDDVLAFDVA